MYAFTSIINTVIQSYTSTHCDIVWLTFMRMHCPLINYMINKNINNKWQIYVFWKFETHAHHIKISHGVSLIISIFIRVAVQLWPNVVSKLIVQIRIHDYNLQSQGQGLRVDCTPTMYAHLQIEPTNTKLNTSDWVWGIYFPYENIQKEIIHSYDLRNCFRPETSNTIRIMQTQTYYTEIKITELYDSYLLL